jgi:RNA polymerase II subunit A small phosphatase-like protein
MRHLLVLDLDETLVSGQETLLETPPDMAFDRFFIYFRPHYKEFLEEMGKHFDIAIWTASSDTYALPIVQKLFEGLPPPVFVFTSERATTRYNSVEGTVKVIKRLKKVKVKFGYPLTDILIVDDKKDTFQDNRGNGIEIRPFDGDSNDEELLYLTKYILGIKGQNYREVYKEDWRKETFLCLK